MDPYQCGPTIEDTVYGPYPPGTFSRLPMSLIDQRENDQNTQSTLYDLLQVKLGLQEIKATYQRGWPKELTRVIIWDTIRQTSWRGEGRYV